MVSGGLWGRAARAAALALLAAALLGGGGCDKSNKISALEPNYGNVAGSDDVVILGNGFQPGITVHFGDKEVRNVVIDSPGRLRVKTPPGVEGKVDVIVTREDGVSFGLKKGFTYRKD